MKVAREYMAENNNIQDKELDIPCRHIGLKLACRGRAFTFRALSGATYTG